MTRKEAIKELKELEYYGRFFDNSETEDKKNKALFMAIEALEQEPCDDAISRSDAIRVASGYCHWSNIPKELEKLPSVSTEKTGRCKDCQYFQHDSIAIVDGIPLIVAHEICTTWGDGCKTREDGYCFMYTPKVESEDKV